MTLTEPGLPALIAVALMSIGLPEALARRRALAGGVLLALALASLEVSGALDEGTQPGSVTALATTMGILLLGLCMALSQLAIGLRNALWRGPVRVATLVAGAMVLVLGMRLIAPLRHTDGWITAIGTAVALGVFILVMTHGLVTQITQTIVRKVGGFFSPRAAVGRRERWDRRATVLFCVHATSALAALVIPQLNLFLTVVLISLLAGVGLERHRGRYSGWPVWLILVLPAIGIAWYLLAHVAGGEGLSLAGLRDAPYSPAFELLASLILGLVGWSLLGLWPNHGTPRGPFAPLIGAALFVRLIAPALPEGLAHWQPVLFLLVALAAWHAAATHRDEEALVALGALGLMSGTGPAGWAGVALVGGAVVLSLSCLGAEEGLAPNVGGRLALRGLPLGGAVLVLPVLAGALGAQVFYAVMTVAGVVTLLWQRGR